MEPLKENIKFSTYTGDDDSTTEAHIRQKVSYGVVKMSDVVHTKRSLATRLYHYKVRVRTYVFELLVFCMHFLVFWS